MWPAGLGGCWQRREGGRTQARPSPPHSPLSLLFSPPLLPAASCSCPLHAPSGRDLSTPGLKAKGLPAGKHLS